MGTTRDRRRRPARSTADDESAVGRPRTSSGPRRAGPRSRSEAPGKKRRVTRPPAAPSTAGGQLVTKDRTRATRVSPEPGSARKGSPRPASGRGRSTRVAADERPSKRRGRGAPGKSSSATRKKKRLSRHPEAVRSRRRRKESRRLRQEQVGILDQLTFERAERERLRAERRREKRAGRGPDLRRLARGWLEEIRNIVAGFFRVSLRLTYAVESGSPDEGDEQADRQRHNMRTPWLEVGCYDLLEPVGYADLADAFEAVRDDLLLETEIHPQRMSQIRIVYQDPHSKRGEGDSVVSKIGAWEFVISDLIAELVGAGPEDEDSLAVRYKETAVPKFYVYFSAQLVNYVTRSPWQVVGLG